MSAAPEPEATLRRPADLAAAGLVSEQAAAALAPVAERYAIAITPAVARLIDRSDPNDPIARQFVPTPAELAATPGERADPIGDAARSPVPGLVHRYPDRVLLKLVHTCPVYCRFCFRRESVGPGGASGLSRAELAACLDYIRARPAIYEVIFSGGDPLILSARRIGAVTRAVAAIPHVAVLRWHSRVPVVAPERITPALVAALRSSAKAVYVALHANHPRELGAEALAAIARLVDAGIPMVSQTVLLKGVNDDAATLEALMRAFLAARVKPYYLHHGDLAPGTAHLRTTLAQGRALMAELQRRLTGLARPAYVLDLPGGHGKVPAGPAHLAPDPDRAGAWLARDPSGAEHRYPPPVEPGER